MGDFELNLFLLVGGSFWWGNWILVGPYGLNFTLCNLILMTSAFFKCTGESGLLQIRTVGILLHFFMKQSQLKFLLCLEISFLKDKLICIFFWTSQSDKRGKEGGCQCYKLNSQQLYFIAHSNILIQNAYILFCLFQIRLAGFALRRREKERIWSRASSVQSVAFCSYKKCLVGVSSFLGTPLVPFLTIPETSSPFLLSHATLDKGLTYLCL